VYLAWVPSILNTKRRPWYRYFNRDVECIRTFFRRRFRYESNLYPRFRSTIKRKEGEGGAKEGDGEDFRLDVVVAASGFKHNEQKVLEEVSDHSPTDSRVVLVVVCQHRLCSIWRP